MKNLLLISLIGIFFIPMNKAYSQYVIEISVDQPPVLEANAGSGKTIDEGESVELGADPAATGGSGTYIYSWTPESSIDDPDAENPTASPESTTDYYLVVEDGNQCSDSDTVTVNVKSVSGFSGLDNKPIKIYPNPAQDVLNIQFTGDMNQACSLKIVNLQGKIMKKKQLQGGIKKKQIDISALKAGVYFIQLSNREGSDAVKFIINK